MTCALLTGMTCGIRFQMLPTPRVWKFFTTSILSVEPLLTDSGTGNYSSIYVSKAKTTVTVKMLLYLCDRQIQSKLEKKKKKKNRHCMIMHI